MPLIPGIASKMKSTCPYGSNSEEWEEKRFRHYQTFFSFQKIASNCSAEFVCVYVVQNCFYEHQITRDKLMEGTYR